MSCREIQPSDNNNNRDEIQSGPTDTTVPARHRVRRLVLTGVAGAVLVGGGGAYAFASGDGGSATTSPSAPVAPGNGTDAPKPPADAPPVTPPQAGPHIDGEVTAVDGSTITVKDPDGFTRTIKTSGDTKYDGVSSPLATGTKIHATGTVDSDGTSLDATAISAMPTPGAGGPAGGPPAPPAGGSAPAAPGQGTGKGGSGSGSGSSDAPSAPSGAPSAPSGAPSAPSGAPSAPSDAPSASPSASGS